MCPSCTMAVERWVPISLQIFIAPDVLDAPSCRRVQAAMDAGAPEPAEVLADGFELQHDVRRATQIEVADAVLAMVDAALDRVRIPIASLSKMFTAMAARTSTIDRLR